MNTVCHYADCVPKSKCITYFVLKLKIKIKALLTMNFTNKVSRRLISGILWMFVAHHDHFQVLDTHAQQHHGHLRKTIKYL